MSKNKKEKIKIIGISTMILALVLGISCSQSGNGMNIILISIDTLRADHLHCYGYPRETSPNIDRIAKGAIVFENAISQSAWTLPSHVSMMTGLFPYEHGLVYYDNEGLEDKKSYGTMDRSLPTLAKILKKNGYRTISYNGGGWVDPTFGLNEGFDLYKWGGRYFKDNVPKSLKWIQSHKKSRFFLFLHAYDVHPPFNAAKQFNIFYEYEGPHKTEEITVNSIDDVDSPEYKYYLSQYDAGIRRADYYLGLLFDMLKEEGLDTNTVVIITSDHGEMLKKRHGRWGHIYPLYEELIRVPLIIKIPGQAPARFSRQVPASVSLLPTILDIAGIQKKEVRNQYDLMRIVRGESIQFDLILSETGRTSGQRLCRAVRTDQWKLSRHTREKLDPWLELFDIKNDPTEQKNMADQNEDMNEVTKYLLNKLEFFSGGSLSQKTEKKLDEETLERLRSLGYIK